MSILHRYVLREMAGPFVVAVGVITFIGVMSQVLRLLEKLFSYQLGAVAVFKMLFCAALPLLAFSIPAGVLLAVLVAIGRLSSDSEMIALRAAGVSLWQIMAPVVVVSLLATAATGVITTYGAPWGLRTIEQTFFDVTKEKAAALLPERAFQDDFFGVTIYVDEVEADGSTLSGVFLADERDPRQPFAVTAAQGAVVADIPNGRLALRLRNATVDLLAEENDDTIQRATFEELDLTLVSGLATRPSDDPYRMFTSELREHIGHMDVADKKRGRLWMAYYKRYAQPLSCLVFGFLGLALGIANPRSGRSRGVAVSVVLLLGYYILVRGGDATGERGVLPPLLAAWGATVLFGMLAAYLFVRRAQERETIFERFLRRFR